MKVLGEPRDRSSIQLESWEATVPASERRPGPSKLGLQAGVISKPPASVVSWVKGARVLGGAHIHESERREEKEMQQEERERRPGPEHKGEIMASNKVCK